MEDASPAVAPTPAAVRTGVRSRFLAGLIVVVVVVLFLMHRYGYETLGMGRDVRIMAGSAVVLVGLILAFFLGGFSWRGRIVFLFVLLGIGFLSSKLVRKVHVDGAMIPREIEWIWQPPHEPKFDANSTSGDPAALLGSWTASSTNDCPEFRGPKRDGVTIGPALARNWKANRPRMLWGPIPVGLGYGAVAAAGDHLVSLEQRLDREAVVCYQRETGREIWTYSYPARFHRSDIQGGDGPGSTPTVVGDRIFTLGATGVLNRIDGRGKLLWSVNVLDDVKTPNLEWGMSGSPLVAGGLVIVNAGVAKEAKNAIGGVVAYDVETGKRKWTASDPKTAGYSSPQLSELGGVKQVLIFDADGLAGLDPNSGKQFWRTPWTTNAGVNAAQPLLVGDDSLFISSGYMTGAGLFKIVKQNENWAVERIWRDRRSMQCKMTSPVVYGGNVYGVSDSVGAPELVCVDAKTGKRMWRGPEVGYGQVILRDGVLIVVTEKGSVLLAAANPNKYEELGRLDAFNEKTWNTPTLAGDRLYLRNHRRMACFQLPTAAPALAAKP